jgi:general secretion pathway protein N
VINRAWWAAAAALFALTVLVRAPASWLISALPKSVECRMPAGSMWHGSCGQLAVAGAVLSDIRWQLHPWALLGAHLELALQSADARAPGTATVALGFGGRVTISDLHADLQIGSDYLPLFPSGWSGRVQLALNNVELKNGRLANLHGTVTALSLAQIRPAMPFGSYELSFPVAPRSDGAIAAQLRDVGGPLAVSGTLIVRNGSDYVLSGLAAARADANPELAKAVEYLGPSDPQGRHQYSLAGSF